MSFNLFSTVFLEKLPSTKSLNISLAILFFSGCVCCIFARIHDLYWAELLPKDRLITTWGFYVSLMCFVGASAIPCAPIRAAIIAIYTVCGSSNEHRAAAQIEQPLTIEEVILLPPRIEKNVFFLAGPVLQNTTDNQVALYPNDNPALTQETKLPVNGNTAETKKPQTPIDVPVLEIDEKVEAIKPLLVKGFWNHSFWGLGTDNSIYFSCALKEMLKGKNNTMVLGHLAWLLWNYEWTAESGWSFKDWINHFFSKMGRPSPKDTSPNKYSLKNESFKTSFMKVDEDFAFLLHPEQFKNLKSASRPVHKKRQ